MKKNISILAFAVCLYLVYAFFYNYQTNKRVEKSNIRLPKILQRVAKSDIVRPYVDLNFITFRNHQGLVKTFHSKTNDIDSQWVLKAIGISDSFNCADWFNNIRFTEYVSFYNCFFDSVGCEEGIIPDATWTDINFMKGVSIDRNKSYCRFNFSGCNFFEESVFRENKFLNAAWPEILFQECSIKGNICFGYLGENGIPFLKYDTLDDIKFHSSSIIGKLQLNHCFFNKQRTIEFFDTEIPDTISLSDIKIETPIELTTTYNHIIPLRRKNWWTNNTITNFLFRPIFDSTYIKRCKINLIGTDINMVNLEYKYFKLYFPEETQIDRKSSIYQSLLEKYKRKGESESYERLDKDYHDFQGGLFNTFSKYWWNYGYSKWLIFIWSIVFIIIFSIFNYKSFTQVFDAYTISSVKELYDNQQVKGRKSKFVDWRLFVTSVLYTFIVFFGIKLDVTKLNFSNLKYSLFILLQFLLGLICTGFIINLILH